MHDLNDTYLVEKIKQGSEPAFREIYERYHLQMYYIAKKYVKDQSLAEDAVQDIFVKVWEKRDELDTSKSIRGYFFVMLKNHVLNMIRDRKKKILSGYELKEEHHPRENRTVDDVIYSEYLNQVKQGINELTDRKKEVFELKMNGHSNAEVAEMLQISIRTVKTHYYNSSKFVRAYLKIHANIMVILVTMSLSLLLL